MTFDSVADAPAAGEGQVRPAWLEWTSQHGEMGARVAAFDWASTSMGPLADWPLPLRGAVMLCVGSLFPMSLRVGEESLIIYNDACRETLGQERFDLALGRPSYEVLPETSTQLGDLIESVRSTGKPFFASDRRVHLNRAVPGEECYFTFCYTAVVDNSGTTLGVLTTFIETTQQILAQRRLGTVAELAREVVGGRPEAELAEIAMQVLATNSADHPLGALYRAPKPDRGVGAPLASFGDPIDTDLAADLVQACLAGGVAQHVDARDGGPANLHAFPVFEPEGHVPTHVLVIAHHRARPWDRELETYFSVLSGSLGAALLTQSELWTERRRVARAAALDAAKSAFFAGISHELRTPLALIAAPIEESLSRDDTMSARTRQDLRLVQANVTRLTRMVEAMLDFSRMEAGRLVPNLEQADVSALIGGLANSFAPAMQQAGLDFSVDLPELSRTAIIDRDFLERIVLNLLSNALKFTPGGSVGLRLADLGDRYQIAVSDTGLGIDPEDHERVFARFERLSPPAGVRAATGAGIGLAMVRQLTELLGGKVSLESARGSGSTFTLSIPFEPQLPAGVAGQSITPRRARSFLAELESWSSPATGTRTAVPHPRLLVVEDDAQLAQFLADSLADSYQVGLAVDGEVALAAIREESPDIVLSDLAMPNLDGLGLVQAIRADPALRDLPVILLSARSEDEDAATALGEGADDYVSKPFTMVDLRARLAANLNRARERSLDAAWRHAVMAAIHDGLVIFDSEGTVIELNQAFTDLLGYSLGDEPIRPPYPWWPTEEEDPEALAEIQRAHELAMRGQDVLGEFRFYRHDRTPIWVWSNGAQVRGREAGLTATVRTVRDITREKAARERRIAAAQVSADFSSSEDLDTVLAVAEHGFELLFDGGSTVRLTLNDTTQLYLSGGRPVTAEDLPEQVRLGLAGAPNPDTKSLRPGILLVPRSSASDCRAWIQFPRPRRIGPDEMIVADLLAQAFALAVDRVIEAQQAADREANLHHALESHRLIGQAVGILVERHRLLPSQAFERLKVASQNRNLKLREVAARMIETGAEPEDA